MGSLTNSANLGNFRLLGTVAMGAALHCLSTSPGADAVPTTTATAAHIASPAPPAGLPCNPHATPPEICPVSGVVCPASGMCPMRAANASDPALVYTAAGPLRGIAGEKYRMWLGVPFAEPPLDDLRWMPPRAKHSWAPNTLEAFDKKDNCAQSSFYGGWEAPSPDDPHGSTEDCLYMVSGTSSQVLEYSAYRVIDAWC